MAELMALDEAVRELVHDGDTVALEGFTHLIPFAAGHEIIRQRRRDLTLVRMTPDLVYDQLIGAGCARKLVFSWGGNPGVGSLHRFRDAVEHAWPGPLELEEHSHAGMANRYVAGASGLPFAVLRGYAGTDLPRHIEQRRRRSPARSPARRSPPCRALHPDVGVIHAQRADREGNVQLWGITGVQKEAVLAAARSLVTVEEIVDELEPRPGAVVLPAWVTTAVAVVPRRRPPVLRARLLRPRQRLLPALGRDQPRPRQLPFAGWTENVGMSEAEFTADEMMTVAAARALPDGTACFVGIGLPSTAANLARRTHAPRTGADLRVRHDRRQARPAAAVHRRRRAGRDRRRRGLRAGDLQLLAPARPHRRRLPRRRPDRPARQHQHAP